MFLQLVGFGYKDWAIKEEHGLATLLSKAAVCGSALGEAPSLRPADRVNSET